MELNPDINLDPKLVWEEYSYLEQEFIKCTRYVPLVPEHYEVWSLHFVDILLKAGSVFDSFLKRVVFSPTLNEVDDINKYRSGNKKIDVVAYYNIFETYYRLSSKEIYELQTNEMQKFKPFSRWNSNEYKKLLWWNDYTDLKHDRFANKEKATLKSVVNALGSLFLLNVLHLESIPLLVDYDLIRGNYDKQALKMLMSNKEPFIGLETIFAKSRLFGYVYELEEREFNTSHKRYILSPSYPGFG